MSGAAADIAVIGMSCRFPGVHNPEEFWRLLLEGRTSVGRLPESRVLGPESLSRPETAVLATGSYLDSIDGFDAGFFGVGPAEAAAMDPVQRLGLELAWEAVEDAGLPAGALAGREIDVLVGAAPSGYDVLRRQSGGDRDDHYAALGSSGALIANRISSLFDVRGMSFCADSGQSSSLVSLALACERIRGGAVDLALVGGVHLIADPEAGLALANLGALSPDGRCFTFDERANGFVRGEGGAFVLLKRGDLALADEDRIYALVRGWGVGNGGASSRMPDPSPVAQAAAVRAALDRADVVADGVDYIEAHGTGTRLGDPAEIAGLRQAFGVTGRSRPLVIGSVKTNVGHLEPAAGITGFVKTVLCLEHATLVPSLNFRSPNPAIARFHEDFEVLSAPRTWPESGDRPRRAGVSAFGMGGTNAHVIVEQAPQVLRKSQGTATCGTGGWVPWVVSGRSEAALRGQAERLLDFLAAEENADLDVADVGWSLASSRSGFEHRAVVLGRDRDELVAGLASLSEGAQASGLVRGVVAGPVGPVVFVFPGQGSQWVGMGRALYAGCEVFARSVDECARALGPWIDWSLVDVVTGAGSAASLDRVDVVQPALFAVMVSLARVWGSLGVVPDAVIGHSQGEIAAACVAGALSLEDAAKIVALRSQLLATVAGQGGMAAILLPEQRVRELLEPWDTRLGIAAVNGPNSTTVSGETAALGELIDACKASGVRAKRIPVSVPGHSPLLDRFEERLTRELGVITPLPASMPIYSTVTGGLIDPARLDTAYWFRNLRSTVRFGEVVEGFMRERGGVFVEVSPHSVLGLSMAETADVLGVSPLVVGTLHKDDGSLGRVLTSLAELYVRGVPVDWRAVFGDGVRRIGLPTYAFQRQRYWLTAPEDAGAAGTGSPVASAVADLGTEDSVLKLVCAETATLLSKNTDASAFDLVAQSAKTFKDLGFDSLMSVQLRNRLTSAAGVRLPATVVFSYPTPQTLGRHIFSLLEPREPLVIPDTPAQAGLESAAKGAPESRSDSELYELIDRGYV